jgi:hypothetical protein
MAAMSAVAAPAQSESSLSQVSWASRSLAKEASSLCQSVIQSRASASISAAANGGASAPGASVIRHPSSWRPDHRSKRRAAEQSTARQRSENGRRATIAGARVNEVPGNWAKPGPGLSFWSDRRNKIQTRQSFMG